MIEKKISKQTKHQESTYRDITKLQKSILKLIDKLGDK